MRILEAQGEAAEKDYGPDDYVTQVLRVGLADYLRWIRLQEASQPLLRYPDPSERSKALQRVRWYTKTACLLGQEPAKDRGSRTQGEPPRAYCRRLRNALTPTSRHTVPRTAGSTQAPSLRLLAHETAHIFGLAHCIYFSCLMNGSNHLAESDRRPLHLCPVCLRKLQWSIGFDVVERYSSLERVAREASFMDEAKWLTRQLKRLSSE